MWHERPHRVALLELLQTGKLRKRSVQAEAWQELLALGWVRRTTRQDELSLVPDSRADIERILDRCWPDWRSDQQELLRHDLAPTEAGLRSLHIQRRADRIESLPHRLNQRSAAASLAAHSKARLREQDQSLRAACELTTDYLIRLRGCQGLSLHRDGVAHDAALLEHVQGELTLSERALLDGTVLRGSPDALLLIENLGAFVDLSPPPGWLLVHVPGWDTQGARRLFAMLPHSPTLHFGDFDPKGHAIYCHLRAHRPNLIWVVPDWLTDYLPTHGLLTSWPDTPSLSNAPPAIQRLAQKGCWVEQEALILDERLWPLLQMLAHS